MVMAADLLSTYLSMPTLVSLWPVSPKDAKAVVLQSLTRKLQAKKRLGQVSHKQRIRACWDVDRPQYLSHDELLQTVV